PLIPPSIEKDQTFSVVRQFWNWVDGWLPPPITAILNTLCGTIFRLLFQGIVWFLALFTKGWLGVLTGLIVVTIAAFFGWLGWGQWRNWLNVRWLNKLPHMERLYLQMLQWSANKGFRKHPSQTPLEYALVSYQYYSPEVAQVIDEICHAYVSWRYGDYNPNWQQLQQRWQTLKKVERNRVS
ncbi:MAG: DUF4129 domain-containing protein, partial [Dolichospermum sp.]